MSLYDYALADNDFTFAARSSDADIFMHYFLIMCLCGGATLWWDVDGEDVQCP